MSAEDAMTLIFGDIKLAQAILWCSAAVIVLVLIVRAWPKFRAFFATIDALTVLPGKLKLLDEIHHEVRPNTGSSLNDAIRRVEREQSRQAVQLNDQSEAIAGLQSLMENGDAELSERVEDIEKTINPEKEN